MSGLTISFEDSGTVERSLDLSELAEILQEDFRKNRVDSGGLYSSRTKIENKKDGGLTIAISIGILTIGGANLLINVLRFQQEQKRKKYAITIISKSETHCYEDLSKERFVQIRRIAKEKYPEAKLILKECEA